MRDFNLDVLARRISIPSRSTAVVSSMPMMARPACSGDPRCRRAQERRAEDARAVSGETSADVLLMLVEATAGKTDKELTRLTTVLEFDMLSADGFLAGSRTMSTTSLKGTDFHGGASICFRQL